MSRAFEKSLVPFLGRPREGETLQKRAFPPVPNFRRPSAPPAARSPASPSRRTLPLPHLCPVNLSSKNSRRPPAARPPTSPLRRAFPPLPLFSAHLLRRRVFPCSTALPRLHRRRTLSRVPVTPHPARPFRPVSHPRPAPIHPPPHCPMPSLRHHRLLSLILCPPRLTPFFLAMPPMAIPPIRLPRFLRAPHPRFSFQCVASFPARPLSLPVFAPFGSLPLRPALSQKTNCLLNADVI